MRPKPASVPPDITTEGDPTISGRETTDAEEPLLRNGLIRAGEFAGGDNVKTGEDRKINAERGVLWTPQQGQRRHSGNSDCGGDSPRSDQSRASD